MNTKKNTAKLKYLKDILRNRFSKNDIRSMCFDLCPVDFEDIDHNSKLIVIQNLLTHLHHRDQLDEIIKWIETNRFDIKLSSRVMLDPDLIKSPGDFESKNITVKKNQYFSCLISYSKKDEVFARKIHGDLVSSDITCWAPFENMNFGERLRVALNNAILTHARLILILSKNSLSDRFIEQAFETASEIEESVGHEILIPLTIDNAIIESELAWCSFVRNTRYIGDFGDWEDPSFYSYKLSKLLQSLRK